MCVCVQMHVSLHELPACTASFKCARAVCFTCEKTDATRREGKGKGLSRDERRRLAEAGRRSARSEVVRSLAAEVAGAPEEERYSLPGLDR